MDDHHARYSGVLVLVLLLLTAIGCSGPAACPAFDADCRRAANEIEEGGMGEVVSVRELGCVERPGALACYVFTLAGAEEVPATVYTDRIDVGR